MNKRAEEAALKAYPILFSERNLYDNGFTDRRESYIKGYEQAEKDIWSKIEKYLSKHYSSDFATVGWILKNIEEYKKKIMEDEE